MSLAGVSTVPAEVTIWGGVALAGSADNPNRIRLPATVRQTRAAGKVL